MTKNHGLTPLEKCQIFAFLKSTFFWYKIDSFPSRTLQTTLLRTILLTKKKKLSYFSPKIRKKREKLSNPLKKNKIFDFLNRFFLRLKWLDFYLQGHKTHCSGLFCWKTKQGQNFQFFTKNHGLTPLEKCQFSTFLNPCFVVLNG